MEQIVTWAAGLPQWTYAAAVGLVALLAVTGMLVVQRRRFIRRLDRYVATPGTRQAGKHFSDTQLLRYSPAIERRADRRGPWIVRELGLDRLWIQRLQRRRSAADMKRLLKYSPETGLFTCFLVSLGNRRRDVILREYLNDNSDFLQLRALALSGRGEEFSGAAARDFFSERLDEVREMTGDPEWPSRYFAVKILLYDNNERSERAVWDALTDPHPLVRKTAVGELRTPESERLYAALENALLRDPVREVRESARRRIAREFTDHYQISAKGLEREEAIHLLQHADPESDHDQSVAVEYLGHKEAELRLVAARALERAGGLRRLFVEADLADRPDFDRREKLLSHAAEVNVTSFLSALTDTLSPATLLLAARLLQRRGNPALLEHLARQVFALPRDDGPAFAELYQATVAAIHSRGERPAQERLAQQIERLQNDREFLAVLLRGVPAGHDGVYAETLLALLTTAAVPCRDELRQAILTLDPSRVFGAALEIVEAGREAHPHRVRIDALKLLGELKLPYALQTILENLPILPLEEAREYTRLLDGHQGKELERKTRLLLNNVDGSIRASLIAALPATGKKTFLPEIKKALGDADPDVRIAATWSLVEYDESRSLTQAAEMLRDPLERVRSNVARAIGIGGTKGALKSLQEVLSDENEVDSVKLAAIQGLAAACKPDTTDMLVDALENGEELQEEIIDGLAHLNDAKCLRQLIERFKDASPALRESITEVFKRMGQDGEDSIRDVLAQDIPSLRPFLTEILESTGYVESRIRLLNHRDPSVRRGAAEFLSAVGTAAAFRGIVLAARDPDQDVRVKVTKALERLATPDGEDLLHALEQDPDRRIRKYTHWALERIKAKKL